MRTTRLLMAALAALAVSAAPGSLSEAGFDVGGASPVGSAQANTTICTGGYHENADGSISCQGTYVDLPTP